MLPWVKAGKASGCGRFVLLPLFCAFIVLLYGVPVLPSGSQGLKLLLPASATLTSSEEPHRVPRMLPELYLWGPNPLTALNGLILRTFYRRAAIAHETSVTTEKWERLVIKKLFKIIRSTISLQQFEQLQFPFYPYDTASNSISWFDLGKRKSHLPSV